VNPRQVFADDSEGKQLCTREEPNDRCQEGETWYRVSAEKESQHNIRKHDERKERECEAHPTCNLQGHGCKAGHHVHRMREQFVERISRSALGAWLVPDWNDGKAVGSPGK
jgi:hypothetical protein